MCGWWCVRLPLPSLSCCCCCCCVLLAVALLLVVCCLSLLALVVISVVVLNASSSLLLLSLRTELLPVVRHTDLRQDEAARKQLTLSVSLAATAARGRIKTATLERNLSPPNRQELYDTRVSKQQAKR